MIPDTPTLHLTLKREWFNLIASGEKKEEYREIKGYWDTRLEGRQYSQVIFRNGYSKGSRRVIVECLGITKGIGRPEWGAPAEEVYIIKLGKIKAAGGTK